MGSFSTVEVAKRLGVKYSRLDYLVRKGRIKTPKRDATGHLRWHMGDLRRAGTALGFWPGRQR